MRQPTFCPIESKVSTTEGSVGINRNKLRARAVILHTQCSTCMTL